MIMLSMLSPLLVLFSVYEYSVTNSFSCPYSMTMSANSNSNTLQMVCQTCALKSICYSSHIYCFVFVLAFRHFRISLISYNYHLFNNSNGLWFCVISVIVPNITARKCSCCSMWNISNRICKSLYHFFA